MGARVTVTIEGLDQVLNNLTTIQEKAPENLQRLTAELAKDTETAWKEATPRRTGRLQDEERAQVSGLSFTLEDAVYYYKFVNDPHRTPAGWRTRHGYRLAKRRSEVPGKYMTEKAVQFVVDNIEEYLARFLDDV